MSPIKEILDTQQVILFENKEISVIEKITIRNLGNPSLI